MNSQGMTDQTGDSKKALCRVLSIRRRESIAPLAVERITVNNGRLFVQGEPPSFSPTEQIGRRTFPNRISLLRFSFRKFMERRERNDPRWIIPHPAYTRCSRIFRRLIGMSLVLRYLMSGLKEHRETSEVNKQRSF